MPMLPNKNSGEERLQSSHREAEGEHRTGPGKKSEGERERERERKRRREETLSSMGL